jgi:predicted nucleic acid-binding Zn ribbon protein
MSERPRPIADSIRAIRAEVEPATLLAAVQGRWVGAVGERIATEAWPTREREGTITVACRKSTWAQELDLMQSELVERVNGALGEPRVRRLRFIVGDGGSADPH